ncbi:MAG: LysR substrate-binding domain-containing protein [Gammaproteobacteria bacterium]|jgi:LysR family transcriptional regulator, hydrogen peroxide-inducible genes activator
MTLTELRYIVAVYRERHFGRAAESCYVSQPTLSAAVKKLEQELGVSIFERSKQDISATPVGEQVVEQAQRVLEEAEKLKQISQVGKDQLSGTLRIGAIYTIGPYLLPHIIPELRTHAPNMPLVIEENFTAKLREKLKAGQLDAIIIALPFDEPGIVTLPLYDEPFVAVLPSSHPATQKDSVRIRDLAKENLLLLGEGHCFRDQVLDACPECKDANISGEAFNQTIEGSSIETIRHMVVSGIGVTVLPCTAAGTDKYARRLLHIKRLKNPEPTRCVALAWRASFPRPKAIEVLRQAIVASKLSCVKYKT